MKVFKIRLSAPVQQLLRCPACKSSLELVDQERQLRCLNAACGVSIPIVNGIPCLINENASVFSVDDFVQQKDTFFKLQEETGMKKHLRRLIPNISINLKARQNYRKFAGLLLEKTRSPRVLVLGGSILGEGMEAILSFPSMEIVESDVSFGPRTTLILDAHDIPFKDESFDGVIVQAVLEHVVDPNRCVEEVFRVLKKEGLVYAETPFIQQVHGRQYDFTRFTHLGHRRLFRKFKEIESGAVGGPGMALAWSYQYFLLSFTQSKLLRKITMGFAQLTSFFLKYFDYYLINKPGALDAASGYYFMGQKSNVVLSDKELIKLYKGAA